MNTAGIPHSLYEDFNSVVPVRTGADAATYRGELQLVLFTTIGVSGHVLPAISLLIIYAIKRNDYPS